MHRYGLMITIFLFFLISSCSFQQHMDSEEGIAIGALLPLSGKNAPYGLELQQGIELAREEINAAGGINGKQLEVIYEDDQADPMVGVQGINSLISIHDVPVVLGSWASGVVLATAPIAEDSQTIILASAISPKISDAGDYIFRIQPSATYYTKESALLLRELNYSTTAILFINNAFGQALANSFENDFVLEGGSIVAEESYLQGDTDFRAQLIKIKETNPEVIFIAGYQDTLDIIKQIKELGLSSTILASPAFESKTTLDSLGPLAEGVLYPHHFYPGLERSKEFEKNYERRYNQTLGGYAPLFYDGVHILSYALKLCEEDTECIKDILYQIEYDGVMGTITFDTKGDPDFPIIMKTVNDGIFLRVEN